jgi:NADH-quinone oxidoreductase subunit L
VSLNPNLLLPIALLPLLAAVLAGLFGGSSAAPARTRSPSWAWARRACCRWWSSSRLLFDGRCAGLQRHVYTWLVSGGIRMQVGFLVDR